PRPFPARGRGLKRRLPLPLAGEGWGEGRRMNTTTVYVPRDSAALAVGADEVATALRDECARRGLAIKLVRNGSRGLFWLEPLVEVATPQGRIAYGPVAPDDVPALLDAGLLSGTAHALCR